MVVRLEEDNLHRNHVADVHIDTLVAPESLTHLASSHNPGKT